MSWNDRLQLLTSHYISRVPNTMPRLPISSIGRSWTIRSRVESWNYFVEPLITSASTWNLWLLQLCRTYYFIWSPQLCETFVASVGCFCYGILVVSATKLWSSSLWDLCRFSWSPPLRETFVASKSSTGLDKTPFLAFQKRWNLWPVSTTHPKT